MPTGFDALAGHRMDEAAMDRLLRERGIGVLSMTNGDRPYGVPLSFGYAGGDRLYFLFAGHSESGRKETYAERSETASFLVYDVDAGGWRSVIVEGPISRITIDEWDAAREAMGENAYRPELVTAVDPREDPRVWTLEIERKTGRTAEG